MQLTFDDLTKDISKIDLEDILPSWLWLVPNIKGVALVSVLGDIFLVGDDDAVYWLRSGDCALEKAAETLDDFKEKLNDEECFDNWFLPGLVETLIAAGKALKDDQVYGFKKPPVLGGDYSVDNMEPTSMRVHFSFAGQICEQLKDLPDGTRIGTVVFKPSE